MLLYVLPAGAAAEDADAAAPEGAAEQLSSETELGRGMLRALWRWASFQVPDMSRRNLAPRDLPLHTCTHSLDCA